MNSTSTSQSAFQTSSGFTLIEFIVALVILAVGSSLLVSFVTLTAHSADPMIQAQARSIATSYMDEILLRSASSGNCDDRATFESIDCYHGRSETPHDQFGNPIAVLSDYQVDVAVVGSQIEVRVTRGAKIDFRLQSIRGDY
jgi:prepilin-type N-terminal cleavage/methylation domain-containing protein